MRDKMNELTKRIVSCVLLMMIGLGCFFGISGWQSSPETHRTSIEYLNEKQATVMKLTAASTAASAAVSALPGDTGSAIAEKLADLTSDFLIVLCAIMLEKYLLTITGYAVFRFILPAVCVLLIVRQFRSSEILAKLAFKLALFGMAVWLAVSGGITVSRMIEATYETSLSQTIEDAQSAADAIDTSTGSDSDSDSEKSGFWSGITSSVQNTVSGVTEKFEQLLSNVMEALAVLIVTSCVLPVLVLLFLLWLQISWTICLFGAELTYAGQNIRNFSFDKDARNISRRYRDFISILIMSFVAKRFEKNEPPYTAEDISEECQIPIRLTNQTLYELQEINLLHEVVTDAKSQDIAYQPSMDISKLNVALLLDKLDTHGSEDFKIDKDKEFHGQWETLMKAREEYYKSASQVLLKDL